MLLFWAVMVLQWLALLPHSKTVLSSSLGPTVTSMHALPVSAMPVGVSVSA